MNNKNAEGYPDPTAATALARVAKDERKYRPMIYVCSPYSGDIEHNISRARGYCRYVISKGGIPVAPSLLFPQFMDDNNPVERKLGMSFGDALMDRCSEVWVFGNRRSPGMKAEFDRASEKKMTIKFVTEEGRCKKYGQP